MRPLHPVLAEVTARIVARNQGLRHAYLQRVDAMRQRPPAPQRLGCANVAHAFAAMPGDERLKVVAERAPNLGVVTAYNDMLSAHRPYEGFPALIRQAAHAAGPPSRWPAGCRPCATG
jgi:phosphogluconate dehydratase